MNDLSVKGYLEYRGEGLGTSEGRHYVFSYNNGAMHIAPTLILAIACTASYNGSQKPPANTTSEQLTPK